MSDSINVRFIIQIAGKPIENVTKALNFVKGKLEEDKNFKVKESEIIDPELDEETTLYSGLLEVLIKFDHIQEVLDFIVNYTPNSVQVEDPENLKLDAASLSNTLNDFSSHLLKANHQIRVLNATLHNMKKDAESSSKKKK